MAAPRAGLVLDVVLRLVDLSDVVVVGRHPREQGISADGLGRRLREAPDHEAVVVGARRLEHQLA